MCHEDIVPRKGSWRVPAGGGSWGKDPDDIRHMGDRAH